MFDIFHQRGRQNNYKMGEQACIGARNRLLLDYKVGTASLIIILTNLNLTFSITRTYNNITGARTIYMTSIRTYRFGTYIVSPYKVIEHFKMLEGQKSDELTCQRKHHDLNVQPHGPVHKYFEYVLCRKWKILN